MFMFLLSLGLAVLPAWLLIRYFVNSDKYPEPPELIRKTFWRGIGIIIPVLIVALPLTVLGGRLGDVHLQSLYSAFATAAIPEEFFKFCVLYYFCSKLDEFDEPMDGIVYGATISLGFAAFENILYSSGDIGVGLLRAFTAVPAHAAWGGIMGCLFARAHFAGEKPGFFHKALFIPILLHGLYNFFLFTAGAVGSSIPEGQEAEGEGIIILMCLLMFLLVLGTSLRMVHKCLKEMRAEQDAMPPHS